MNISQYKIIIESEDKTVRIERMINQYRAKRITNILLAAEDEQELDYLTDKE